MGEARREHEDDIIDVEALAMGLKGKMSGNLSMPSTCSIFRVPTILSRHSPNAFTPNFFSFGPFHHHNEILKLTEKIKSKYLLDLISRSSSSNSQTTNPNNPDAVLKALTEAITDIRAEARQYYSGPIDPMTMAEFVEVLVLDGCFIVELFRKKAYESLIGADDPIFNTACFLQYLWHDLILLENQVPWKVLERLYDLTIITQFDEKPLVQLAIEFFETIFSMTPPPIQPLVEKPHESKHILDLLRNSLILPSEARYNKSLNWEGAMRSATALLDSSIEFRPCNESQSVLDIEFDKEEGVLKIPSLFIQETTQTVLRNLISLEQCCPNYDAIITSYAALLENLINTRADMEILCKSKAITTWLNIDEATKCFDRLYIDTFVKETFYLQLIKDVNDYCKQPWHNYRRRLCETISSTRTWAMISVIASFIALILTFLQTVFGIIKP